jgi:hypothetical protein
MRLNIMHRKTAIAIAAIMALSAPAIAQDQAAPQGWQFSFEPYFMAASMDGKSSIGPLDVRVSSSPSDIFSNLNWGVMGLLELNNGRFGLVFDGSYMNLEASREGRIDTIGGHQGAYSVTALVRIQKHAEAYAGIRVNDLGVRLAGTGPLGNPREASRSESWVDPIIGMRVNLPLSGTTDFTMLADVGGFGIASDIAVQAWPTIGFRLSDSIRAKVGYRLIYTQYETGEGLTRFEYDVLIYGPTVGVKVHLLNHPPPPKTGEITAMPNPTLNVLGKGRAAALLAALVTLAACSGSGQEGAQRTVWVPEGPTVNCITKNQIRSMRVIDDRTIDFEMTGRRMFRNNLPFRCSGLGFGQAVRHNSRTSQLCSLNTITVRQPGGGWNGPVLRTGPLPAHGARARSRNPRNPGAGPAGPNVELTRLRNNGGRQSTFPLSAEGRFAVQPLPLVRSDRTDRHSSPSSMQQRSPARTAPCRHPAHRPPHRPSGSSSIRIPCPVG